MEPEVGLEKEMLPVQEMTLSERPPLQEASSLEQPPFQGTTTKPQLEAELNPETGVSHGSEQEPLIAAAHSSSEDLAPKDTTSRRSTMSKLRQKKEDVSSLVRGLNWEGLAIVTCLCLSYLLCSASYSIISPFFPIEGVNKDVSFATIGLIIGISPLTVAILSPLYGRIAPRVGSIPSILLGLFLVGSTNVAFGFVNLITPKWGFIVTSLILRILEGIGSTLFVIATMGLFPVLFPDYIGILIGLFELAAGLGYVIGYIIGGVLYEAGGFRLPFISFGGAVLLLSIPTAILIRKKVIKQREVAFLSWKLILRISTDVISLTLIGGIFVLSLGHSFYSPILQPFLYDMFNFNGLKVALIFLIASLAYTLSIFVVGPLVDRVGNNRYFSIFGLTLAGISLIVMGILFSSGIIDTLVIGFTFLFLGIAIAFGMVPVFTDFLQRSQEFLEKEDSPTALTSYASGLVSTSHFLGEFLGTFIGGVLGTFLSFPTTSIAVGELALAEALLLLGVTVIHKIPVRRATARH